MKRLAHIDALRGLAALAVCWFHMTHGGELPRTFWFPNGEVIWE